MVSRRQVLVAGGSGIVALSLEWGAGPAAAAALRAESADVALFLLDSTIAGSITAAGSIESAGIPVAKFAGDIGTPWLDRIEPMWRDRPQAIAGITHGGAFFCLEQLARTYGLACTFRLLPISPGSGRPVDTSLSGRKIEGAALSVLRVAGSARPRLTAPAAAGEAGNLPLAWLLQPTTKS